MPWPGGGLRALRCSSSGWRLLLGLRRRRRGGGEWILSFTADYTSRSDGGCDVAETLVVAVPGDTGHGIQHFVRTR